MNLVEYPVLSEKAQRALAVGATLSANFMFMGNHVRIRGNAPGPLDSFRSMYEAFAADQATNSPADIQVDFQLETNDAKTVLTLVAGGKAYRVRDPDVIKWAFGILTYLVLLQVRSHYLVHAGCVARDGLGIVIAGDSRMGKTTLVSHLVTRGFGFLSDELAPISRTEAWVEPFPRRLSIRKGPAEALFGKDAEAIIYETRDDFRTLVGIEDLAGAPAASRVPLRAAVFLTTQPEGEVRTAMKFDGKLRVTFTDMPGALEEGLRAMAGVEVEEVIESEEFPGMVLGIQEPTKLLPRLRALADEQGVEFAEFKYESVDGPSFDAEPLLVPIPATAGVIELVKKMPGSFKRALAEDRFDGKLSNMIEELSGVVREVKFYRLSPGRLEQMLDLVEGLSAAP